MSSTLIQDDRKDRATSSNFYHLMHSADVDHTVELINDGYSDAIPAEQYGKKAIVKNAGSSQITVQNLGNNDIVMWNGTEWEIYMDVSNASTNNGIVFDKRTQKFYQYTPVNGWSAIVDGKSTVDGGTY